jgi:hypothetical protein
MVISRACPFLLPHHPSIYPQSEASTHDCNILDAQQSRDDNMTDNTSNVPEGVFSLLDTDLYKLTMQCCILKFFPDVPVTYSFTNRTPDKKLNRAAYKWLQAQVASKQVWCSQTLFRTNTL